MPECEELRGVDGVDVGRGREGGGKGPEPEGPNVETEGLCRGGIHENWGHGRREAPGVHRSQSEHGGPKKGDVDVMGEASREWGADVEEGVGRGQPEACFRSWECQPLESPEKLAKWLGFEGTVTEVEDVEQGCSRARRQVRDGGGRDQLSKPADESGRGGGGLGRDEEACCGEEVGGVAKDACEQERVLAEEGWCPRKWLGLGTQEP